MMQMARKLQDRLALASYKAQNGLDHLSFNLVEAHLENTMKRKRTRSSVTDSSDSSSSVSENHLFASTLSSSLTTAPIFSDEIHGSERGQGFRRRNIRQSTFTHPNPNSASRKRSRAQSTAPPMLETTRNSWKSSHRLPESSPVYHHQHARFPVSHESNLSFVSHASTVPDSPPFGPVSGEDHRRPEHSFSLNSSNFHSSPPRTPPPTRPRSFRPRKSHAAGEEGADLLLYLATSPSPANAAPKSSRIFAPSTPPSNTAALPSSMMSTPGGGGGGGGSFMAGFNTPGQQFNFADFVNITPSPAQGAFGSRTPGLTKTPLAAKEARRRLNFDSLAPPGGSPIIGNGVRGSLTKETGLGMELGGELVS